MNVSARSFFHTHTGEECAIRPCVIARAVIAGIRIEMLQTIDDLHTMAE